MIPEIGHYCAIAALIFALGIAVAGHAGAATGRLRWVDTAASLVVGQFWLILFSMAALIWAFVHDDFSVAYVARNSNSLMPWYYKVSAVWGAHEGSFLLWIFIMTIWTLAVAFGSSHLPREFSGRVLGTLGLLNFGFLLFLLSTSSPFTRLLPIAPADGATLNPLLQDFGLIVHPPLLYTGYVGFSVAFSFAVAALLTGRLDAAWARWSRPWTNAAWAFLTVGVTLGSWWAYYELGWGGWWFWDPVENASFMPWLVGTALVHSLAVTEKRGAFKSWTVLLAIAAFSLSLLGAFIVRSGVLTSVHAFAVDPERGLFILTLLGLVVGGSLFLYALRAPVIRSRIQYDGISRELLLLVNNLILVIAMAVVFLGTLYPLAYEALNDGAKISVGPPYFNRLFVPLMMVLAFFLALAPVSRWKRTPLVLFKNSVKLLGVSIVVGVAAPLVFGGVLKPGSVVAGALGFWIVASHGVDVWRRYPSLPGSYVGMTIAHLGFAVSMIGIAVTSEFSVERDVRLSIGETIEVNGTQYRFTGMIRVQGPNYVADQGQFVLDDGTLLQPEKRRYSSPGGSGGDIMTEAAIDAGLFRDRYVALGEPLQDGSWGVRIHDKPLVRWTWLGGLLMCLGGLVAVTDARYRRLKVRAGALAAAGAVS